MLLSHPVFGKSTSSEIVTVKLYILMKVNIYITLFDILSNHRYIYFFDTTMSRGISFKMTGVFER